MNISGMIKAFFLVWLATASTTYQDTHPIHVSVSEIVFNPNTSSLEITHKIFLDDFEKELEELYQRKLYLGTDKQLKDLDELIKDYLDKRFIVEINKEVQKKSYVGKEIDLEAIWIYQEIPYREKIRELRITDTILIPFYDDQRNIVHVKYLTFKGSILTHQRETSGVFIVEL